MVQRTRTKKDVIFECVRQLGDIKTNLKISEEELKEFISEIQNKLKRIVENHMYKGNCTKKEARFLTSNMYIRYSTLLYNLENPQKSNCRMSDCSWI